MKLKCTQNITIYGKYSALENGNVVCEDNPVHFCRGEEYDTSIVEEYLDKASGRYFTAVAPINNIVQVSIQRAEAKCPYTAGVLKGFYGQLKDKDIEIAKVILKRKSANLREGMKHHESLSPEHGICWSNAIIFEELIAEIERNE